MRDDGPSEGKNLLVATEKKFRLRTEKDEPGTVHPSNLPTWGGKAL